MDEVKTLIKGATLVTPHQKALHGKKRDILIVNGKITRLATKIEEKAEQLIAIPKLHVSVGWFDLGAGFGEPGYEERGSLTHGAQVAALSGFSNVLLWPDTRPVPDHRAAIRFLLETTKKTTCHIHPLGTLSKNREGKELAELYDMKQAGAVGFYDSDQPIESPSLLKIALQYCQSFGSRVFSYPVDGDLKGKGIVHEGVVSTQLGLKGSPALAEASRIARDLQILEYTGGKLHIPGVSTRDGVKLIEQAKKKDLDVSCSTSLHHLCETDENLREFDTRYKVSPPLRSSGDQKYLQKALLKGSIDFLQSDHRPRTTEEKQMEFDLAEYGSLGLESVFGRLQTIYTLEETVEILSRGYRFLEKEIPELQEGAIANLTLFRPDITYSLQEDQLLSKTKNSMHLGKQHKGISLGVIQGQNSEIRTNEVLETLLKQKVN